MKSPRSLCMKMNRVHLSDALHFFRKVLDPNMDLRTVKHFIWKSGGDLTLHYRQKSTWNSHRIHSQTLHIQSTRSPALPGSVWRLDHQAVGVTHVYPSVNKQEICGETLKDVTWKGQWLYLFLHLLGLILFSWHEFSWRMPYWTCPTARVALVLFVFTAPLLI